MVQNQSMNEVLRRTRNSIARIEDRTRQSIVRLEQRLQLKRKAIVRALVSLCLPLLALILALVDPVQQLGKLYMKFSEGYPGYDMFEKPPIGTKVKIYLFNVTNMEQFLSGGDHNMKLQEIGPFTYLEYRTNDNITKDPDRGVIRYIPQLNVTFLPELSVGRPEDFRIIVPNTVLLSMTSVLADYSLWSNLAFNMLARNLGTQAYKNLTVQEYLWNFTDPLMDMMHTVMPGWITSSNAGLLKLFYEGYGEQYAEMEEAEDSRYRIRDWNGEAKIPYWNDGNKTGSVCNNLQGSYEGMFFTPGFTMDTKFHLYRRQLCRTMPMVAVGANVTSFGVKVLQYSLADDAFDPKPENDCICKNGKCLPRGLSSMAPCLKGVTFTASKPHFMDADPSVLYKLEGLKPDKSKHGTLIGIDPVMGLPLMASSSSQTNIGIGDAKYTSVAKPFRNIYFPVLWVNMEFQDIPSETQLILRWRFIFGPALLTAVEVILLLVGLLVLAYNVFRYLRPWTHLDMEYQNLPVVEKEMQFVHKNPLMDDIYL